MAAIKVRILSREFIKPSTPTPNTQSEIKFSGLDQIFGATRFPRILFYQNSQPSLEIDSTRKSLQLKESLSLALTKFYPFAGRMNEDSSSLICNDHGALFLEAQVDANLTDSSNIDDAHYFPTDISVPLAVQLTFFACGGTSIGINFSHWIADGWTFDMFMNHWAAISAGIGACAGAGAVDTLKFGLGHEMFPPRNRETLLKTEETPSKKIVSKRFLFNKEKIASLKKLAPKRNPTRVEVVMAFVMKQIIQMNRSKASPKSKVVARIAVNLRQRLGPPVDNSTMGNFIISTLVPFMSDTKLDFGILVDGFIKATSSLKTIDLGFDCVKYCSEIFTEIKDPDMWSCLMSSLCGFPVNDVDFGWGKPLLVRPVLTKPAVAFVDARYGSGIEVWMNLFEDDMEMLPNELLSLECPSEPFALIASSRI